MSVQGRERLKLLKKPRDLRYSLLYSNEVRLAVVEIASNSSVELNEISRGIWMDDQDKNAIGGDRASISSANPG